ncbi:hypothetical protein CW731_14190 [Polaribacter sp. ALD11]|uniref:MBG domain-containing protein n=1 Tax=Polaribacter sp. ALD11 TaxID=2058137 RepID=UPI000C319B57|nr:MBG domain-containing protein [Polaribacter sp. ALD11]AUC86356.1 hypothetical protein CW731_14190 [Polaribacter sp. ALD11]
MKKITLLIAFLFLAFNSQTSSAQFTEDFSSVSCFPCSSFSFTQEGIQYDVITNGNMETSGGSIIIDPEASIKRNDGGDFTFTSILINNVGCCGAVVTVSGYNNNSLVGDSQTVSSSNSATLSFSIGTVDEVKISSIDFFKIDNFSATNIFPNTAPVFENSTPVATSITSMGFTLETDINEAGTIYYVVLADGATAPTAAEVKAGTGNAGASVVTSGNATVNTGGFTNDFIITNLTENTTYNVYVAAEDDETTPLLQASATLVTVKTFKSLANIVISEIMYNSPERGSDENEYIELYNAGTAAVDLTGYSFSKGVTHTFTTGSIAAGAYFVIAVKVASFEAAFGAGTADASLVGSHSLSNGGEEIELVDDVNRIVDYVHYDNRSPWPTGANGDGPSMELRDITSDNNVGANWSASNDVRDFRTSIPGPAYLNNLPIRGTPGLAANFDIIAPVFENSKPVTASITTTGFTLETDLDEAGTIYYVVLTDGATAPTAVEVKAGTGNGGASVVSSGNIAVNVGDFTNNFNITGLTNSTAYDVYVIAEDDEAASNLQANPTKIEVTTLTLSPTNNILYVKKNISGGNGEGDSWANAVPELADALVWANKNKANFTTIPLQIWVAGGTYKPLYSPEDGENFTSDGRNNAFSLANNVQIYGGFVGTETTLANRNLSLPANTTILSGDIGTVDDNTDNTYHVVVSAGDLGTARLDGFTIVDGYADSDDPAILINTKEVYSCSGAGIYNSESVPFYTNLIIQENSCTESGGGMFSYKSRPSLQNSIFKNNQAKDGGGMANQFETSATLLNISIINNNATTNASGLYNVDDSNATLINVTLAGNRATVNSVYDKGVGCEGNSSVTFKNSIIWDAVSGDFTAEYSLLKDKTNTDNGNIDATDFTEANLFKDSANEDYSLSGFSPLINAGDNSFYSGTISTDKDLAGNARLFVGIPNPAIVDLGAYEYQAEPLKITATNGVLYVNKTTTGNKTGESWANAIPELADALVWANKNKANFSTTPLKIWVAGGTYKPLYSPRDGADFTDETRDNAFLMVNNVQLYGGFTGTETTLAERDLTLTVNKSILSGDIGVVTDDTDNANNVVVSFGVVGTARLDGFTVSSGRANDARTFSINNTDIRRFVGGGMFNRNSSPTITNTIFIGNKANIAGGGLFNLNSSPGITNSIFIDNSVISLDGKGGGMFNNSSSSPTITNTTFSGNSATDGSGMSNQDNSNPIVNNTIITGIISNDNATPVYKNSIIADKSYDNDGNETTTNLTATGLFKDPTNGDYSLKTGSIAVNAGSNTLFTDAGGNVTTDKDLAGNPRVFQNIIDMGAYESQTELIPSAPTTTLALQIYAEAKTVADLQVTGTAIKWYDAAIAGNFLDNTTVLTDNTTYYASQMVNGVESTERAAVIAKKISEATQTFLSSNNPTVANLVSTPSTGTMVKWYATATGSTALENTDALSSGTYYVAQTTPLLTIETLGSDFSQPFGIALQSDGKILVADTDNNAIKLMDADGTNIQILGTGFTKPRGIVVQPDGKILVADAGNNAIKRMDADGTNIVTLNSTFNQPHGVALQSNGKILVADSYNSAIKRMDANGGNIETLGSGFSYPYGITVQYDGEILVADAENNVIKRMDANGDNIVTLGTGFIAPSGVALQSDGKILVVGSGSNPIKRMNADGSNIETLGTGFNISRGVAVQADGKILVADTFNNTIKRIREIAISNRVAVSVVVKATPTITFEDFSKTYGDAAFDLTATSTSPVTVTYSIVAGGTGEVTLSGKNITIVKAGTVTLKASIAEDATYDAAEKTITLTIDKADLKVTAQTQTRIYGNTLTLDDTAFSLTGLVNGDTAASLGFTEVTIASESGYDSDTTVDANTYANEISASGLSNANYNISYVNGNLVVTKRPISFTNITLDNKIFDGNTIATANENSFLVVDLDSDNFLPNGQGIDAVNGTYNFANANVANNIAVTVTFAPTGSNGFDIDNYTINSLSLSADIQFPTVAFTTTSSNGLENVNSANLEVILNGSTSNTVTVEYTVTGTATSGVDYTLANGTLTFDPTSTIENITIANIIDDLVLETDETVILTLSNPTNATLGTNTVYTYTIINNDTAKVTIEDVNGNENGGTITLTATLDNAVQGGFTVDINTNDGTATLLDNDYVAINNQTLTFVGNIGETQTFTVTPIADSKGESNETFTISQSNLLGTSTNVNITDTAMVTINNVEKAPLTFANISKIYGDTAFSLNATSNSTGNITYSIVAGDPETVTLSGSNNSTVTLGNVGSVSIKATVAADASYLSSEKIIILQILPKAITVVADTITKVYGETDPIFTYSATALLGTDSFAGSLARATGEEVGTYAITQGMLSAGTNYTITFDSKDFIINKAQTFITAVVTQTHTYDGTVKNVVASLNHAETSVSYASQQGHTNAGSYTVEVTAAASTNYEAGSKTVTLIINKATQTGLVLTAASHTYDSNAKALAITGAASDANVVYENNNQTNAGTYNVKATVSRPNYEDAVLNATLTIDKAQSVITADAVQTFTYDGTVKNATASLNHSETTIAYAPQQGYTDAGSYVVEVIAVETTNYKATNTSVTLNIEKATQTIVFNEISIKSLENDVDFQLNATASSGLPINYTFTYSSVSPAAIVSSTGFVELLSSGIIEITATQIGNNNYVPVVSVKRELNITSENAAIFNITIGGQTIDAPEAQIYYLVDCGNYTSLVDVVIHVGANANLNVAPEFSIETLTPGIYRTNVVVNYQDGTQSKNYEILIEKAFHFEDIIDKKYNNTLIVNNNPATNGGHSFVSYKWFKNGVLVSEKQFFSEGDNADNILDPNATYQAVMVTEAGYELRTCVSQVELDVIGGLTILQNPIIQGNQLKVRADFPKEELKNAIFQIFDLNGRLITTVKVRGVHNSIELPTSIAKGVYTLVVITSRSRDFKRFINN